MIANRNVEIDIFNSDLTCKVDGVDRYWCNDCKNTFLLDGANVCIYCGSLNINNRIKLGYDWSKAIK